MRRKSKNIRKWRNDIKIFTKLNKVFYRIYTGRVRWLMIMVSGYTTCHDIDCKLQQAEYRKEKLNEEDFVRFCYNLRPECEKKIEDRACIADLGSKDGLMESVFPIIKEIPSERFIDKEYERQLKVRNHDKMAFVTAITNSDAEDLINVVFYHKMSICNF